MSFKEKKARIIHQAKINIQKAKISGKRIKKKLSSRVNITLVRIILAVTLFLSLIAELRPFAVMLFSVSILAKVLDIIIEKYLGQFSHLKTILDSFADKLLIVLAVLGLFILEQFPWYAALVFVLKEILVVVIATVLLLRNPKTLFKTNRLDKITYYVQLLVLLLAIVGILDTVLLFISLVLVVLSFLVTLWLAEIKFAKKKTDYESLKFRQLIELPDYITGINILGGMLCIFFALKKEFAISATLMIVSVVADIMDGKVARIINRQGDFGKQLDSLADTLSFGIAPAVFGYTFLVQVKADVPLLAVLAFGIFILCGILRLARYNIMEDKAGWLGMPIVASGYIVPIIYFTHVPAVYYPYVYLVMGFLMISSIRIRRIM